MFIWTLRHHALQHLKHCSQYDLAKIFFTSKFSCLFFSNPTNKTETGTRNRWGTTNSKPPGPIDYDGLFRNTDQQSDHIYYTLFCTCMHTGAERCCCAFYQQATCGIMRSQQNQFPEPNWHIVTRLNFIWMRNPKQYHIEGNHPLFGGHDTNNEMDNHGRLKRKQQGI